jgi:hypothetical protein
LEERQESGVSFTKIDFYYRANRKETGTAVQREKVVAAAGNEICEPGIQETYVVFSRFQICLASLAWKL